MKSVFAKDGVVIGLGAAYVQDAIVHCDIAGAVEHQVANETVVDVGWTVTESDSSPVFNPPTNALQRVSPVQFKLLFTVGERVAIKASEDPIVKDFFEIVNDPRLTFVDLGLQSTQQALQYLEAKALIGAGRPAQILTGIIQ